jgi:hypothetical protein
LESAYPSWVEAGGGRTEKKNREEWNAFICWRRAMKLMQRARNDPEHHPSKTFATSSGWNPDFRAQVAFPEGCKALNSYIAKRYQIS